MKFLFFCLFLITGASYSVKSQTSFAISDKDVLKCAYRLNYRLDSTSTSTKTELLNLFIGKGISKFESRWVQQRDSLTAADAAVPDTQESTQDYVNRVAALARTDFKYSLYKVPASGKMYYYDRVGSMLYRCEQPLNSCVWTITKETEKIAGFVCQRATTSLGGRSFEAWFTREVAISEGPYKFSGLPGLIVRVNDTRHYYTFELIKLTKLIKAMPIALPTRKSAPATMAQLWQGSIDYALAVSSRQAAKGFTVGADRVKQVQEEVKRRNNPLELK